MTGVKTRKKREFGMAQTLEFQRHLYFSTSRNDPSPTKWLANRI